MDLFQVVILALVVVGSILAVRWTRNRQHEKEEPESVHEVYEPELKEPELESLNLVVEQGENRGDEYTVSGYLIRIGNMPGNEVHIESPGVSGFHACLMYKTGVYMLEDLTNTNATSINGVIINKPQPIYHGDIIGLGDQVVLRVLSNK